jgi:hypothetical protein
MLRELLTDPRLKYIYSETKMSVVDNFERAFGHASGDFVIALGDDDCIGPGVESIAQWAKELNIDVVNSYGDSFVVSYFWPGVKSRFFGDAYSSRLFVWDFSGSISKTDAIEELRRVARSLGSGPGRMPRVYHGLVARSLVDRVKRDYGQLFGGVSPDIYSSALISANCERAVMIDFPFVIPGASPPSTAGQGAERTDRGGLRDTEHVALFGDELRWDPRVPEFYSPDTVWAYSLCEAVGRLPELGIHLNFARLYARSFIYYRSYRREVIAAMKLVAAHDGWPKLLSKVVFEGIVVLWSEVRRFLSRLIHPRAGGSAVRYGPHDCISSAFVELNEHAKRRGVRVMFRDLFTVSE